MTRGSSRGAGGHMAMTNSGGPTGGLKSSVPMDNSGLQNVDRIREEFPETWLWVDNNTEYIINILLL